jgi:hypothetical protein
VIPNVYPKSPKTPQIVDFQGFAWLSFLNLFKSISSHISLGLILFEGFEQGQNESVLKACLKACSQARSQMPHKRLKMPLGEVLGVKWTLSTPLGALEAYRRQYQQ